MNIDPSTILALLIDLYAQLLTAQKENAVLKAEIGRLSRQVADIAGEMKINGDEDD